MYHYKLICLLASIAFIRPLVAYQTIAHRGVFHDVDDKSAFAENSVDAMYRAETLGLPGVELDLRLSSDNQVLVVHDIISNRATVKDNYGGRLNAVDVALNQQPAVAPIKIKSHSDAYWVGTGLKTFGRNSKIVTPDGAQKLETLDSMLTHFKNLQNSKFWLILDVQDPTIFSKAAALIQNHGLSSNVFLKFFATKAINSKGITYNGADTCYRYARDNHLSGLQIIPQINDGELTIEGNSATINVFNTKLTVQAYLACWADAQKAHAGNGAALMPLVSASVPANNNVAYNTAKNALSWAKSHGRKTISILPNPDAGRIINTQCTLWTYQSGSTKAVMFDKNAQKSKSRFISETAPDYAVVDVMGDVANHKWIGDYQSYIIYLC